MKYAFRTPLFAALIVLAGCSGTLSTRTARQQIASLGGSTLIPSEIEIERIMIETGSRAVAETSVRMAFQFEKDAGGEWRIVSARLGDRQWVDVNLLLQALERQYSDDTSAALEKLAAGVEQYQVQNGSLPQLALGSALADMLHPLFMVDLIRQDAWGREIQYERRGDDAYVLRSSGPDRVHGSPDDIILDRRGL